MSRTRPARVLRSLMRTHGLRNAQVAELLGVSVKAVESWLSSPDAASHRNMPARYLRSLDALLPAYLKQRGAEQ